MSPLESMAHCLFGRAILEELIRQHADEHHCSHDCEFQRAVNAEQDDQVLQDAKDRRADQDSDD